MATGDEAGWHPDAAGRHELRYWDGGAWTDNVSDKGVAGTDLVGGKPLPSPSQAAAKAAAGKPAGAGGSSKAPLFVGIGAVAVVLIAAIGFFVLKGDDKKADEGTGTFTEQAADVNHPVIHKLTVGAKKAIFITMTPTDGKSTVGYIVLTQKATVDKVVDRLNGADSVFTESFDDVFSDLRAEDIGAKGDVGYFGGSSLGAGESLHNVVPILEAGDYEVIPLVLDDNNKRIVKDYDLTLEVRDLDLGDSSEFSDLESEFSDNDVVTDFIASDNSDTSS
jgi:hypothetical protein